jgi:hypothetical protein
VVDEGVGTKAWAALNVVLPAATLARTRLGFRTTVLLLPLFSFSRSIYINSQHQTKPGGWKEEKNKKIILHMKYCDG